MANRITCQHDPLQPNCSLILESGILGRRVRCEACDIAAVAKANGTFKCSPYPPARPSLETGTAPEAPEKTWDCSICGRSNYVTATHCEQCEFSRTVMRCGQRVPRDGQR